MFAYRLMLAFLFVSLFAQQGIAQQDKSPLAHIPSDFSLVVKLSAPQMTFERVGGILNESAPDLAGIVDFLQPTVEEWLGNPGMTGVDQMMDVWMAVRFRAGEDPQRVFLVGSRQPNDLKEALGDVYTFHSQGKWTIYSESEEAIGLFKKLQEGTGKGLNKFIDPNCLEILTRSDLAAWMDVQTMRRAFEDDIELLKGQASGLISNIPASVPGQEGADSTQIVQNYESILETVLAVLKDTRAFCTGVGISKSGVLFDNYVSFSYSSETVKFLKTLPTSDFKNFEKLPQSHLAYFGVSGLTNSFMKWGLNFSAQMLKDEQARKDFDAAVAEVAEIELGSMTWSMDVGAPNEGMLQSVTLLELDNPLKFREIAPKLAASMSEIDVNGVKIRQELKPDEEEYGNLKADVLSMTCETADLTNPQALMQQQMFNSIYGPDGLRTRTFYFDDHTLQVIGSNDFVGLAVDSYNGKPVARKQAGKGNRPTAKPVEKSNPTPQDSEKPSLRRKRSNDDESAMLMIEDDTRFLIAAQTGKGSDDDRKGRGLNLKTPGEAATPAADSEKPQSENPPNGDQPETPAEGTPEGTPPAPTDPATAAPTDLPIPNVDVSSHELPPREVADAMKLSRNRLSAKSNVLLLIDFPALIAKSLQRYPMLSAMGIPIGEFFEAAKEPSFTGVSLAVDGNAVRARVSIPSTQLTGIGKIVAVVRPMLENMQGGRPLVTQPPPSAETKPMDTTATPSTRTNKGKDDDPDASPQSPPPVSPPSQTNSEEAAERRKERRRAKGKDD